MCVMALLWSLRWCNTAVQDACLELLLDQTFSTACKLTTSHTLVFDRHAPAGLLRQLEMSSGLFFGFEKGVQCSRMALCRKSCDFALIHELISYCTPSL